MRLNILGFWFFVFIITVSIIFWLNPRLFNRMLSFFDLLQSKSLSLVNNSFVDVGNTICPVYKGKEPVDKRYSLIYQGKKFHFCCEDCIKLFEKKPDYYIKQLNEKESFLKTP